MKKSAFFMGITLWALSPFFVYGQLLDPVDYTLAGVPDTVQAGEVFEVTVEASIDAEWHLYSILNDPEAGPYPTKFSSVTSGLAIAGEVKESEAVTAFDPNFDTELGWHSQTAQFIIPVAFESSFQGEQQFTLEVLYQVCDDRSCLPPKTKQIEGELFLAGIDDNPFRDGFGFLNLYGIHTSGFLVLSVIAGFLTLLTPRLFPLIPLTVSTFSHPSNQTKKSQSRRGQAFRFGLSVVTIFTSFGVVFSLISGMIRMNQFASNQGLNLGIGILVSVCGLSLLGLFELRLPYRLINWFNKKSKTSSGMSAAFCKAFTIITVSFSSTVSFAVAVLAVTTLGGWWFYPAIGMLGFSVAFASPFILLMMFPGYLKSRPRYGRWMNVIKIVSGCIILTGSLVFFARANII